MPVPNTNNSFGCDLCWQPDPESTWQAMKALEIKASLIDESHFMVKIRRCTTCQQQFVSVFTERIDWEGGDDPQFWCLMPVTVNEAAQFTAAAGSVEGQLQRFTPDRQSLCRDHPKGAQASCFWGEGMVLMGHD